VKKLYVQDPIRSHFQGYDRLAGGNEPYGLRIC